MFERNKKERKRLLPEGMSLLTTADDKIEADVLVSKLEAYGILVIRQYRETGAYLTLLLGNTTFGIDIFVPSDQLEEAKAILASGQEAEDEEILQDPSFSDESLKTSHEEFLKKLDRGVWWMAGIFIVLLAVLIYYALS